MNYAPLFDFAAKAIYGALALFAIFGVFVVILALRRIAQKRFRSESDANQFLDEARDMMSKKDFDGVAEMCDSPTYWSKAVPQLILVFLANRHRPMPKVRKMVAERFERDILANLEYNSSWINTVVKSAPMLGLLGTVSGMIQAFEKIASTSQSGGDPSMLASDISFALFTTAAGLTIAIPLVVAGAIVHVRMGKLQDSVQAHLGEFLDDYEEAVESEAGA